MKNNPGEGERSLSSEQQSLESLNVEQLRVELEALNFPYYLVEGAVDFVQNAKEQILLAFEIYREKGRQVLEEIMAVSAENHIKSFTPEKHIEPIGKTFGQIDSRLTKFLGKKIVDALLSMEKETR